MAPKVDTQPATLATLATEFEARAELCAELPDGSRLCLSGDRVALLAKDATTPARWLSPDVHLRLSRGPLWHRLELGSQTYSLSSAAVERCLLVLGLSRLRLSRLRLSRLRSLGRSQQRLLVGNPEPLVVAAVHWLLGEDEIPLVVARSKTQLRGTSDVLGRFERRAWLLLTDRRLLLFAVSEAADVVCDELVSPFAFDGRWLILPARRVAVPKEFAGFQDCVALRKNERALEVARRVFKERLVTNDDALDSLLTTLAARGDHRALWIGWLSRVGADAQTLFPPQLAEAEFDVDPISLWEHWGLSDSALDAVLSALPREARFDGLAEAWAERAWKQGCAAIDDAIEADIRFARRLLDRGRRQRARQVLDDQLNSLARPSIAELELPGQASDARRSPSLRLVQLRLDASDDDEDRLEQRLQLLRWQPLNVAHLRAIAAASGALGERAREVLCCLREPVVAEVEDRPRRTTPLPADVVERRLRRGLGTDDPSLGERFKTWVAKERRPDPKMLQHYCERVMRADAPIVRIVDEAATLLGLGHVDIYVSRGDDDVGVRAFPAARPFVLVGGQHLDAAATYAMTPNELRFAVGAELLHLRVGNVRVGTRDVMRGALHKGRTGLDLALGVLPLLRGLKLADRLGVLTAKVSLPQVSKALESARGAIDGESTSEAHGLSPAAEKLLEAQRNLQLWADRAGLLCAGSFGAAVRAMAITRHDTSRVARELARAGVLEVIEKQRPSDPEAMEYLLLRVAALAAFYVSFDHSAPSVAAAVQAS